MPKPRRGQLEMMRDLLLAIAMAPGQQEKPTRIMYAIGTSWRTMAGRDAVPEKGWGEEEGLLTLAERKGLIEDIGFGTVERGGSSGGMPSRRDRRSPSIYKVTDRGLLVLRLMDLLYVFLEGEEPQVRMPPAIMRILARASNYGESLESMVQNISYAPRLSSAEMMMDNLLTDMRDDSLVIQEGLPDKDKLTEALEVVTSDNAQRLISSEEKPTFISSAASEPLAQAVNDMPAVFFVNSIVKGVQDLEDQTGKPSMPEHRESTVEIHETLNRWNELQKELEKKTVTIKLSDWSESNGLHCPLCFYRSYSVKYKSAMRRHFKKEHEEYEVLFEQ